MARGSISFDRIADRYEASRGGEGRGVDVAGALAALLPPRARTLEVGVGTGVVAGALAHDGGWVGGVDVSSAMLRHAALRLGGSIARADGAALPIVEGSLDAVVMVWVLHLVPDPRALLAEAARVLRPDGRLAVVHGRPQIAADDAIGRIEAGLDVLRNDGGGAARIILDAREVGLQLVERTAWAATFRQSPEEAATGIEQRKYSALWDLDQDRWDEVVRPVLDRLRALPDLKGQRARTLSHPLMVLAKRPAP